MTKGLTMPAGLTSTLSVLAYVLPAAACLVAGDIAGATPDGIPSDLFQFGALGIVAFMVWRDRRDREQERRDRLTLGKIIDDRHEEVVKMNTELVKALDRNSRAMEACVGKQVHDRGKEGAQ